MGARGKMRIEAGRNVGRFEEKRTKIDKVILAKCLRKMEHERKLSMEEKRDD